MRPELERSIDRVLARPRDSNLAELHHLLAQAGAAGDARRAARLSRAIRTGELERRWLDTLASR